MMAMSWGKLCAVPDYGAIFMSNQYTRKECFERKLFGLPESHFHFVREVKSGMVLFLFQHEKKKLHGVFQAVTDGKMNIVPDAYQEYGMTYPAQVRFRVLWRCQPLSEYEFRDAIEDNYYTPYKLHFGLSKDQVQRLLMLFHSKKVLKVQSPLTQENAKRRCSKSPGEEKRWVVHNKASIKERKVESSESRDKGNCLVADNKSTLEEGEVENPKFPDEENRSVMHDKPTLEEGEVENSESLDDERRWIVHEKPSLEEMEVEKSVNGPPSHSARTSAGSSSSGTLSVSLRRGVSDRVDSSTTTLLGFQDFIPLSSPEYGDATETGNAFSEAGNLNKYHSESANYDDYEDLSFAEACILPKISMVKNLNYGPVPDDHKYSPVQEKEKSLKVKGLYADTEGKRESAFSRLNSLVKAVAQKKEDDSEGLSSINGLMKDLIKRHKKWKNVTREKKSIIHLKEDRSPRERVSAFSRLSVSLRSVVEKKRCTRPWDKPYSTTAEISHQKKKRKESVFLRLGNGNENTQMGVTQYPSHVKITVGPIFADQSDPKGGIICNIVDEQIPSEESAAGKEADEICEGSNSDHVADYQTVVSQTDDVNQVSPKPSLTYYRRRLSASHSTKELNDGGQDECKKQNAVADEGKEGGEEDGENREKVSTITCEELTTIIGEQVVHVEPAI